MESQSNLTPVIAIVGQTASGKTDLAIKIAQQFNGEIIAADSRTIYKGMDIGTAKPSKTEQKLVRHHLLDIITPDKPFSVAQFVDLAHKAIADIAKRGKLPIVVGGTGLYIDALLYGFSFRSSHSDYSRSQLDSLSVTELQALLRKQGTPLPNDSKNPRRLIRQLETKGQAARKKSLRPRTLIIGLCLDQSDLVARIQHRINEMIDAGFVAEVQQLARQYGWEAPGLQTPGYRDFSAYLSGEMSLEEAKKLFATRHLQYAKRQKTWFKRNTDISWISKTDNYIDLITTFLNNRSMG